MPREARLAQHPEPKLVPHPPIEVLLQCCQTRGVLADVDAEAVARGRLEHRRRNLICPGCQRLVILSLAAHGGSVRVTDQEVIDLGPDQA